MNDKRTTINWNKFTDEMTKVGDDGINYVMNMYVLPASEAGVARPAISP